VVVVLITWRSSGCWRLTVFGTAVASSGGGPRMVFGARTIVENLSSGVSLYIIAFRGGDHDPDPRRLTDRESRADRLVYKPARPEPRPCSFPTVCSRAT